MKANLMFFFKYNEKPENEKNKELSDIVCSLEDFCEDTYFVFQVIPRIGEYINAEPILRKWIENKEYKKPCSDSIAINKIVNLLNRGYFKVEEIYHSLDLCTIYCTAIENEEIS